MKKQLQIILFSLLVVTGFGSLQSVVKLHSNKHATTTDLVKAHKEAAAWYTYDGFTQMLSELWADAEAFVEAEEQAKGKAGKGKFTGAVKPGHADVIISDPIEVEKPEVLSQGALGRQITATLTRATVLKAQGKMDETTFNYLDAMLNGLQSNALNSGDVELVTTVNADTNETLKNYQAGTIDKADMQKYVEDTYTWWYNQFNVADQYEGGGLNPDPIADTLLDDDGEVYDTPEGSETVNDSEEFPETPTVPTTVGDDDEDDGEEDPWDDDDD